MPKELTHWYLAARCADRLALSRTGSVPGEVLSRNVGAYLIGAIAPDILYYARRAGRFRDAADKVHGANGENSYGFLSRLLPGQADSGERTGSREGIDPGLEQTFSLVCGILTHIAADAMFHPLVYFYCGYSQGEEVGTQAPSESTERHWIFETCMDLYVRSMEESGESPRLSAMIGSSNVQRALLYRDLSLLFFGEPRKHRVPIEQALRRHARLQRIFESPVAARLLRLAARRRSGVTRFLGLSYPAQRDRSLDAFRRTIVYTHPVTGETQHATFDDLVGRAVDAAVERIVALWDVTVNRGSQEDLAAWRGPSLETGLIAEPGTASGRLHTRSDLFSSFLPFRTEKSR